MLESMLLTVEEDYNQRALQAYHDRVESPKRSEHLELVFTDYRNAFPTYKGSIQDFAYATWGFNPGKCGIGEKCQLFWIKINRYSDVKKLPTSKGKAAFLEKDAHDNLQVGHVKNNGIKGVKCLDAFSSDAKTYIVLKTIDIGPWSDNKGGGSQDNVYMELEALIRGTSRLHLFGEGAKLLVMIDGRGATPCIDKINQEFDLPSWLTISTSSGLLSMKP
jgi:hypothetical protein